MLWFRFIQYAIIFQSIFALLGTSRPLGPKSCSNQSSSCHTQISKSRKETLTSSIGNDTPIYPSVTAISSSTVDIQTDASKVRNARIGASIALILLVIQASKYSISYIVDV